MSGSTVAFATILLLAPVEAEPPTVNQMVALDWDASESCPRRDQLVARLLGLLPDLPEPLTLAQQPEAELRVSGQIEPLESGRWQATLRFEGGRGVDERSFTGRDCGALADAAALVIAVTLDPVATVEHLDHRHVAAEGETAEGELSVANPELGSPESDAAGGVSDPGLDRSQDSDASSTSDESSLLHRSTRGGAIEPHRPRDVDVRGGVSLLGGGGFGPLRTGTGSLGGELSAFGPWWRVALRGLWLPARTLVHPEGEVRYEGFVLGLRGCAVPRWRSLEFPVCAGVEAGGMYARGVGTTPDAREGRVPWVAIAPSAGLYWAVHERLALGVEVGAPISLVRGGFVIDDVTVQEFAPIGVRALLGMELRFP